MLKSSCRLESSPTPGHERLAPLARRRASLLLGLILLGSVAGAGSAQAASGELALGLNAAATQMLEARLAADLSLGLSPLWGLRLEVGAGVDGPRPEALVALGGTLAWDVFAWVPVLSVAGGAAWGRGGAQGRVLAQLALRRYLSLSRYVWLGLGGEWRPQAWRGQLQLGWTWIL